MNRFHEILIRIFVLGLLARPALPALAQSLEFEPTWSQPAYIEVRQDVFHWIDRQVDDAALAEQARSLWPVAQLRSLDNAQMLDLVVETVGVIQPRAANMIVACNAPAELPRSPDFSWIGKTNLGKFAESNLRLYAAEWLVQQAFYDESLVMVDGLDLNDVVDPACLLFCRMIAHHQLVEPDESRSALVQLLEREQSLPLRYLEIANLLKKDLSTLEDESLDHVSRRMNDVRRRLDLGEAGKQVQVVEKGIVDSLDKIIKKIEEQQQSSSSSSAGSAQSSSPMQDSQLPSMKAPGKVDQRDIGHQSGWGDLPPKEREEALQQIGRDYPAHYRRLIEQYFRDLAEENERPSDR